MAGPRPRRLSHLTDQRPAAVDEERWIGAVLDAKYEITRLVGTGGMSAVYEARHARLGRPVAIKILHSKFRSDPNSISRLRNEAQVVAALRHPGICEIYDFGVAHDGSPYLVMERLEGQTLADLIAQSAPLSYPPVSAVLRQVLATLGVTHAKGILHRDLKPENIFLERRSGRLVAKLLDFGIAQWMRSAAGGIAPDHSGSDAATGTPYYMSPEQARGDGVLDERVDLWAIGVVLYECLTGRKPFVAPNYNALLVKILTSASRPVQRLQPTIAPEVAQLVERALAKMREDRFQSARDFRRALADVEELLRSNQRRDLQPAAPSRPSAPRASRWGMGRAPSSWDGRIEDPDTFIDDEASRQHDLALIVQRAAARAAEASQPAAASTHASQPGADQPEAELTDEESWSEYADTVSLNGPQDER